MRTKSLATSLIVVCLAATTGARAEQAGQSSTVATPAAGTVVPRLINFSGILKDAGGEAKTGAVEITFSLYELQDGGSPLWSETQTVQLDSQGRYTVLLGSTHPDGLPLDLFTTGQARWLGVQPALSGVGELPRILLVGVPYAMKAADADTLGGKPASAYLTLENEPASGPETLTSGVSKRETAEVSTAPGRANTASPCSSVTSDGRATANRVAKFTTPCNIENSALFESGGKVGLGATSPAYTLDISDTSNAGSLRISSNNHNASLTLNNTGAGGFCGM